MNDTLFKKAVEESYGKVSGICLRYFGNKADAFDTAQEVFLKVWLNLDKFRGDSSISTWIYRITTNACLTNLRESRRNRNLLSPVPEIDFHDVEDDFSEERLYKETKLRFLEESLSRLSQGDRTLITLYLDDLNSREIASVTGLTEANVRTRIHRIKKTIKKEWEDYYEHR